MRSLDLQLVTVLTAAILSPFVLGGCEEPPPEQTVEEAARTVEEAREKTDDRPQGAPGEDPDRPIEGSPLEIVRKIETEIEGYNERISEQRETLPEDIEAKKLAVIARLDGLEAELDQLNGELGPALRREVADVKLEWNQTKRQIDLYLGTAD